MTVTRKIKKEDLCYVTATCKKCKRAFMTPDSIKNGQYNDTPPTHLYCPDCEKTGLKNKKKKNRLTPEEFLKAQNITDKLVIKDFKKRCKKASSKGRTYENILKESIEVASYYTE